MQSKIEKNYKLLIVNMQAAHDSLVMESSKNRYLLVPKLQIAIPITKFIQSEYYFSSVF